MYDNEFEAHTAKQPLARYYHDTNYNVQFVTLSKSIMIQSDFVN